MKVALGSDKSGFLLKEAIKKYLTEQGIEFEDMGTQDLEHGKPYYEAAPVVARAVQSGQFDRGILICGTGIGISIAANKTPGIRAACCSDYYSAKYTRMHNDANVLCMGGRVISSGLACELVDVFLDTAYEGGRHQRRVDMLTELDKKKQ